MNKSAILQKTPRKTVPSVLPGGLVPKGNRVDTRTPISLWELLVWAYARQLVRYERCDGPVGAGRSRSATGRICDDLAAGAVIRGSSGPVASRAHVDAIVVHEWVMRLPPDERYLLIDTAERRAPPDWNPRFSDVVVRPVLRPNGEVKTLKDKRGKAIASLIEFEGVGDAERAERLRRARECYTKWWRVLKVLRDAMLAVDDLTRWRITGIGAEEAPFSTGLQL